MNSGRISADFRFCGEALVMADIRASDRRSGSWQTVVAMACAHDDAFFTTRYNCCRRRETLQFRPLAVMAAHVRNRACHILSKKFIKDARQKERVLVTETVFGRRSVAFEKRDRIANRKRSSHVYYGVRVLYSVPARREGDRYA